MEKYQTAQHVINEIWNDSGMEKSYSDLRQTLQQNEENENINSQDLGGRR